MLYYFCMQGSNKSEARLTKIFLAYENLAKIVTYEHSKNWPNRYSQTRS